MPSRRCAILTMDDTADFCPDDHLLAEPLTARGMAPEWISWRQDRRDWGQFDLVLIRSPWDYQSDADGFLRVLERIDASGALLLNPLHWVRWNIDKRYLLSLARRGVAIIPTAFYERMTRPLWPQVFRELGSDRLVIKPRIGANSDGVIPVTGHDMEKALKVYGSSACLVQPFVDSVLEEGEYSMIFFSGQYSHSLLKTPASGDFRVQEEHGASLLAVVPEPELKAAGLDLVASLSPIPLYLRADFVRAPGRKTWWLMELELIEPSLYLRMDSGAPERFADAIVQRLNGSTAPGT